MKKTILNAKKMAHSNLSVLISGESGTGKELFAHAIHSESKRSDFPFVAINCSSLPENLLESELFGYEEGAFTGAKKGGKPGLFEQAHKGTIFLDEIGDISPALQTRLLRVVQQKEVLKIGGTNVLPVDVRIIAATNRDLLQRMKDGDFREDLYYRLNVLHFEVPPLRNRKEDISLLMDYFLKRRKIDGELSQPVMEAFTHHQWIGNVRELENTIEYLSIMSDGEITMEDLPFLNNTADQQPGIHYKEPSRDNNILPIENLNINENKLVLQLIFKAKKNRASTGRRNLVKLARQEGVIISENYIRKIINELKESNMVEVTAGRGGTKLTSKGLEAIM